MTKGSGSMLQSPTRDGVNLAVPASGRQHKRPSPTDLVIRGIAFVAVAFLLLPTVFALLSAFGTDRFPTFPPSGWTLDWFGLIDRSFLDAARQSLLLGVITTVVCLVLGVPAGIAVARWGGRGASFAATFARSPLQVPYVVIGVATLQFYVLITRLTGLPLIGTPVGVALAHAVIAVPYMVGAVAPAAAGLSRDLESAAQGLGAGALRTFGLVTLPALRGAIVAGSIFSFLISFDDVPVTLFLVGSGQQTLPVKMFFTAEFSLTPQLFAVSALVTIATTVVLLIVNRVFGLNKAVGV
jgi:putative spermidine/putrescine transport system permease protein